MHLQPGVTKQPNLELKTWPKQLLGSLPLVIALADEILREAQKFCETGFFNETDTLESSSILIYC
jgi:hypothetical protein